MSRAIERWQDYSMSWMISQQFYDDQLANDLPYVIWHRKEQYDRMVRDNLSEEEEQMKDMAWYDVGVRDPFRSGYDFYLADKKRQWTVFLMCMQRYFPQDIVAKMSQSWKEVTWSKRPTSYHMAESQYDILGGGLGPFVDEESDLEVVALLSDGAWRSRNILAVRAQRAMYGVVAYFLLSKERMWKASVLTEKYGEYDLHPLVYQDRMAGRYVYTSPLIGIGANIFTIEYKDSSFLQFTLSNVTQPHHMRRYNFDSMRWKRTSSGWSKMEDVEASIWLRKVCIDFLMEGLDMRDTQEELLDEMYVPKEVLQIDLR